jgi:tripartite-type tricarboxylate transporter receptor subunit TctC
VPKPIVDKLNKAMNQFLSSQASIDQSKKAGWTNAPGTPEALRDLWYNESAVWEKVIKSAGIKAN